MQTMSQPQLKISTETIRQANLKSGFYHRHPSLPDSSPQHPPQQKYRAPENQDRNPDTAAESDCLLQRHGYSIHLVNSLKQQIKTSNLIKRMYASRGYQTDSALDSFCNTNQISFAASIEKRVIGTLSVSYDSDNGLLADSLYKKELEGIRAHKRKVCELSRLAIDPQFSSRELIAYLFNLAYISARIIQEATDFIIEINPRHATYYKRLLGFHQAGETRTCQRVNAPAVLLHLELGYVDKQISCLAGSQNPKHRSLYTLFLTKQEEKKVASIIRTKLLPAENRMSSAACV